MCNEMINSMIKKYGFENERVITFCTMVELSENGDPFITEKDIVEAYNDFMNNEIFEEV